jgi:hypothetical protein
MAIETTRKTLKNLDAASIRLEESRDLDSIRDLSHGEPPSDPATAQLVDDLDSVEDLLEAGARPVDWSSTE